MEGRDQVCRGRWCLCWPPPTCLHPKLRLPPPDASPGLNHHSRRNARIFQGIPQEGGVSRACEIPQLLCPLKLNSGVLSGRPSSLTALPLTRSLAPLWPLRQLRQTLQRQGQEGQSLGLPFPGGVRWSRRGEQRTAGEGAWGARPHHCPELGAHLWAAWQCSLRVPRVCRASRPGKSVWTERAEKGWVWVPCPRAETEGSNTPTAGIREDMMSSMAPYGKAPVFSGGPFRPWREDAHSSGPRRRAARYQLRVIPATVS